MAFKKFKDISIKKRIPAIIAVASFLIFNLISAGFLLVLQKQATMSTEETTRNAANETGQIVAGDINGTASLMRVYADMVGTVLESDMMDVAGKRQFIFSELEKIVKMENLDNLWCVMGENIIDGQDSLYANRLGSDNQGRYAPYLVNDDKGFRVLVNNQTFESDAFSQMRRSGKEDVTEPYESNIQGIGNNTVFSLYIPVKTGDKVVGVVGHDFIVDRFNNFLSKVKNDETVILKLVSYEGIVASSNFDRFLGKKAEGGDPEILRKIEQGIAFEGVFTGTGEALYSVFSPIQVGRTGTDWYLVSAIPEEEFHSQINTFMILLSLLNGIGIILVVVIIIFILRSVLNGFTSVTEIIHQLSLGNIRMQISDHQNKDEVGQMKSEMSNLVKGLQSMAVFAENIGKENLDATYQPLSDSDELGHSLLEMRDNLYKAEQENILHQKEEEQRSWGTQGVAKFAEILRQDNDQLEILSYNVISNLVKYLGANQGGIFILNEEEETPFLEQTACYAYDRKKFVTKRIEPGDGLVGTCYLEGESIYMTDVPEGYINITSGLGERNPQAILITPLKVNDVIYGVIEIASFQPFEPYQLEFVEKLGESIAATINTVKVNIRTNKLLEMSKFQAEEMANQEEELRQNMEEMQATQEEMRRRETELSSTLEQMKNLQDENEVNAKNMEKLYASLSDSFNMIEFSSEGNIMRVNELTLKSMSVTREEVMGNSLSEVIADYQKILEHMNKGENFDYQETVEYDGRTFTTKNLFVPFLDAKGNLQRFVLIFYTL